LELAHALETLGHPCGKKHELQFNFLIHDVIVLAYDYASKEPICYKHLHAQRKKEEEASNPNTREAVKANTVVFTSLALLYNLCSSSKLDWQVCGSANVTHGLLFNNYKMIGLGVYHSISSFGTSYIVSSTSVCSCWGSIGTCSSFASSLPSACCPALFGLTSKFKEGVISDHTEVFVNAFQEVLP
jgi:hypothetical protein